MYDHFLSWLAFEFTSQIGLSIVTKSDSVAADMSKLECLVGDAVWAFGLCVIYYMIMALICGDNILYPPIVAWFLQTRR